MPNAAARSWSMLLPLAAVLLLALLWTVYWFVAAGIAKTRFAEERRKLAAQGVTLACTEEAWGGYPFHFEFTCSSPVLQAREPGGDQIVGASAGSPRLCTLADRGACSTGQAPSRRGGLLPTTADHQRAIAAVTFDRDWKPKLSAEIPALSVPGWAQRHEGDAAYPALRSRRNGCRGLGRGSELPAAGQAAALDRRRRTSGNAFTRAGH